MVFFAIHHPPSTIHFTGSSEALLGGFAITVILTGVLYQLGMLNAVIRGLTRGVVAIVRVGFVVWKRSLAWLPWPLLLAAVLVVHGAGLLTAPPGAIVGGTLLLIVGISACLAYVYLDIERAAVERGYKAVHNPQKGQELAADLGRYGTQAGIPLLAVATLAIILGFASLNHGLYYSGGEEWFRLTAAIRGRAADEPIQAPGYLDFLAYTLINFIRVVDLLDIANAYNYTHVTYVQQAKWPSSTLLIAFRTFFTMVLLQQILGVVRRGNLLWQCVEDYWSPHGPIHDRAALALGQQGPVAAKPLLKSLRRKAYLTPEQRDELAQLLADLGPHAVPALSRALRSKDENKRIVAVSALGRLQALDKLMRLGRLANDPSDAVRQALAETMALLTEAGPQFLAKQWLLRQSATRARAWLGWLRRFVPWWKAAQPVDGVVTTLRRLAADPAAAVRSRAAQALSQLGIAAAAAESELAALLHDADESVRCRAIMALARVSTNNGRINAALTTLLRDPGLKVRIAAAQAAGLRGEAAAELVPALLPMLKDADAELRDAASAAIEQIGTLTEEGKRELTSELSSSDNTVRAQAAEVLGTLKVDAPDTVPALIQALSDNNDQVRVNAAEAIGKAGTSATSAAPALITSLKDPDNRVCALAAWALGEIGPSASNVVPTLVEALGHINPEVRARAAEALGKLPGAPTEALQKATGDAEGVVRGAAVVALANAGGAREPMFAAMADSDPRVREAAVMALGPVARDDGAASEALLKAAGDSSDAVKARLANVIGEVRLATPAAVDALARLLCDDTPAVQVAAVKALGKLGPAAARAADALSHLLLTADVGLRRHVLRSLTLIDPTTILEVAPTALNEDEASVRVMTSAAMLKVPELPGPVIDALIAVLRDPEVRVRSNAALALGRLERLPYEAVAPLLENLTNPDDGLRLASCRALAKVSNGEVDEAFPRLLDDTNYNVRLTAARRLLAVDPMHARARAALALELESEKPHVREAAQEVVKSLGLDQVSTNGRATEVVLSPEGAQQHRPGRRPGS